MLRCIRPFLVLHCRRLSILLSLAAAILAAREQSILHAAAAPQGFALHILSTRPGMVSGGSALVGIDAPGVAPSAIVTELNGRKAHVAFRRNKDNVLLVGLVTGLKDGDNTVHVSVAGGASATLKLVNHPIT